MQKGTFSLRNIQILILFSFFITISMQAQDKEFESPLKKGTWALQFGIAQNFTLSSFQGGAISAKYMSSNTRSMRLGVDILNRQRNTDGIVKTGSGNDIEQINSDKAYSDITYNIRVQYLWNEKIIEKLNLFYGIGPNLGLSLRKNEYDQVDNYESSSYYKQKKSEWHFGVNTALGVEWFINETFSIGVEYGMVLNYVWGENLEYRKYNESNQESEYVGDISGLDFNASRVLFSLSIYL